MATRLFTHTLRRRLYPIFFFTSRSTTVSSALVSKESTPFFSNGGGNHRWSPWWFLRTSSYGRFSKGATRFEAEEVDQAPKKKKWVTKKKLKMQRKRAKEKRKEANRKKPSNLGVKAKRKNFPDEEAKIKDKIERAKMKEAKLVKMLERYEVSKLQGPSVKPDKLTGEERFFLKKMAQKRSNYVQVGVRGVVGGLILNMHLHWKRHETCKVICKPCKPGQVQEYATEIARLSGGIPLEIAGDTIIFYRGRNYFQPTPEVMSPIGTLSRKKALEKFKYEQSLVSVREYIAAAEKELKLYHQHFCAQHPFE